MLNKQQSENLWGLIREIKTYMLVGEDEGLLRARPMQHVQDEFDGVLWFFTSKSSGKIEEFQNNRHACLTYADVANATYVSLSGTVDFTDDKALIHKLWGPFAAAWFPQGKNDPDIALMEVHVTQAEYWDAESGRMQQLYQILKSNLKNEAPDLAEHRKYG